MYYKYVNTHKHIVPTPSSVPESVQKKALKGHGSMLSLHCSEWLFGGLAAPRVVAIWNFVGMWTVSGWGYGM